MDSYLDISILRDPEFPVPLMLNSLYAKLHRALVSRQSTDIAVTFPKMTDRHLGDVLRLIGPKESLDLLIQQSWLHGMHDHVQIGAIANVPVNAQVRTLRREQCKSSPERQKRRSVKRLIEREGITEAKAILRIESATAKKLNLPFLVLNSASTSQTFRLFLRLGLPSNRVIGGSFNAYGISQNATTPWF